MKPDPTARTGRRGVSSKKRLKKSSGERSPGRPPLKSGMTGPSGLRLVLMFTTAGVASLLRRTQSGARIGALWAAGRSVHSGALDVLVKPKWGTSATSEATAARMTMGATQLRGLRVNFMALRASLGLVDKLIGRGNSFVSSRQGSDPSVIADVEVGDLIRRTKLLLAPVVAWSRAGESTYAVEAGQETCEPTPTIGSGAAACSPRRSSDDAALRQIRDLRRRVADRSQQFLVALAQL